MNYKKLKEAKKLYDNILGDLLDFKAMLKTLQERNDDYYPQNFLFKIARYYLKDETNKIIQCYEILEKI